MNDFTQGILEHWEQSPAVVRLGSALLHFVWQGALAAAFTWAILVVLNRVRPQVRYLASLVALGALAVCPVITFAVVEVAVTAPAAVLPPDDRPAIPATVRQAGSSAGNSSALIPLATAAEAWNDRFGNALNWLQQHRPWVVLGWFSGVCLLSVRLAMGVIGAQRARRRGLSQVARPVEDIVVRLAMSLRIHRPVRVVESALAELPTLVGWLRPVILLPASAVSGLTASQLEVILLHELAHVRRHDYLVNLLQTVVETILFYHPAVWWISRRIRQEREHCCDDVAVAICADRVAYARALTAMEELRASAPRWAVAAHGGSLGHRIRRLVGRPERAGNGRMALALVAAVLIVGIGITLPRLPTAYAHDAANRNDPSNGAASNEPRDKTESKTPRSANRPWTVFGRVTDTEGTPLEGVIVTARTGIGTLRLTGKGETNAEGNYEFDFGPGIMMMKDDVQLQAAWISAKKPGFSEKNLSRQGDLLAAFKLPKDADLGKNTKEDVILPGKSRQIDFIMVPAAKAAGTLIDKDQQPLAGYTVALTGDELPPASSVLASAKTDAQGRFALPDIPAGYNWQFLIYPPDRRSSWNAWASGSFLFSAADGDDELQITYLGKQLSAKRFELQLSSEGVHWREALKSGAQHQTIQIKGGPQVVKSRVHVPSVRIILDQPAAWGVFEFGASRRSRSPIPKISSKCNLKRTRPDALGRFTVTFDNPLTHRDAGRWVLDPEKHQVVIQIDVNDGGKRVAGILKQIPARGAGGYRIDLQVDPELVDDALISVTFLTIQPDHDQWVKTFFVERRGTAYRGIWAADSLGFAQVALAARGHRLDRDIARSQALDQSPRHPLFAHGTVRAS